MRGLKELIMIKNTFGQDGAIKLLSGLRFNLDLEHLQVEEKCCSPKVLHEMAHWIKLNRAGRKIFRETNLDQGSWSRILAKSLINRDLDVLFHFLTEKPDVFQQPKKRKLDESYFRV